MNHIDFKEANQTFTKPASMTDEECSSLRVLNTGSELISVWQPTKEELTALAEGACVCLSVFGQTQPPVSLYVNLKETKE